MKTKCPTYDPPVSDFDFPDDLLQLERSCWEAIQTGTLTAEQAAETQGAITAWATEHGHDRYAVEMGLKKAVRHAEVES
jgi:hypothetical protein